MDGREEGRQGEYVKEEKELQTNTWEIERESDGLCMEDQRAHNW